MRAFTNQVGLFNVDNNDVGRKTFVLSENTGFALFTAYHDTLGALSDFECLKVLLALNFQNTIAAESVDCWALWGG